MKLKNLLINNTKGVSDTYFDLRSPPVGFLKGAEGGSLQNEYKQLPIIYSVINAISKRVSSVPVKFYRAGTDTEVSHPVIDRLMQPTGTLTWPQFLQTWVILRELRGQVLIHISEEMSTGVPDYLKPIQPDKYKPWHDQRDWRGWTISGKNVEKEQTIYDRYVNPWSDIEGLSPLNAARLSNETEWSARQFNKRFFDNDATPGGYFRAPSGLTERQRQALKHDMIESRKGAQNAHQWVLLEGDAEIAQIGLSQRDAQFVEQFNLTLHDICAVYGVDPAIIGFEKESKYASAKEARKYMWTDVVIPYLHNIEAVLNNQLLGEYGVQMSFDTSQIDALQSNYTETVLAAEKLYKMGVPFNMINERLGLGFDEIPGGDEPKPVAGPVMFIEEPEQRKEYLVGPDQKEGALDVGEITRAVNHIKWKNATGEVATLRSKLEKKLKNYFRQVQRRLREKLPESKGISKDITITVDDIDDAVETREVASIIMQFLTEAGVVGWSQITGVSRDFDNPPQAVLELVSQRAGMVKEITDNARKEIRNIVGDAIEQGLSEEQTIRELRSRLDHSIDNLQSRARSIARTEVHTAHSEARHRAMDETVPVAKRWIAAPDARDSHLACESQGVVEWGDTFANGLQYPLEPGGPPGEVINCRCILEPIYEGEL